MKQTGAILFLVILMLASSLARCALAAKDAVSRCAKSVVFVASRPLTDSDLYALYPHRGTGPGFLIDSKGHVLCSEAAISNEHAIEVTLGDRSFWPAEIVGRDRETGIVLLRIKAPSEVLASQKPLAFPERWRLELAETVWAIGVTPTGAPSVAQGIVSVPLRDVAAGGKRWTGMIQTTIPVTPSLNGAPLVDATGKLVGMMVSLTKGGPEPGVGFAMNVDDLRWIAKGLMDGGNAGRPWLGATFITIDPTMARLLDLPQEQGILLVRVDPAGPAGKAGLQGSKRQLRIGNKVYPIGGDFLVAIDRVPVTDAVSLRRVLSAKGPGAKVLVSVYRDGKLKRIPVLLEAKRPSK